MDTTTIRFGGAFGMICALAIVPVHIAASDDSRSEFVSGGIVPVLHILFGLAFFGVLVAMLRHAVGPAAGVYIALAGGVFFFTLTAGGLAAEVAYPAAVVHFGDATITEFNEPLLTMAAWFYHYSQIGAVAMIFATSVIVWQSGVLPRWAAAGAILGVLPLVHTWLPLPAAMSTLLWIFLIGLVMLVAPGAAQETREHVDDEAPGVKS